MEPNARLLYPITEAAMVLGVQRTTMYELIAQEAVERVKIGRRSLVTAASLAAFVDRLRGEARDDNAA